MVTEPEDISSFPRLYTTKISKADDGSYRVTASEQVTNSAGSRFCEIGDASFGYFDSIPRVGRDSDSLGAIGPRGEVLGAYGEPVE